MSWPRLLEATLRMGIRAPPPDVVAPPPAFLPSVHVAYSLETAAVEYTELDGDITEESRPAGSRHY